MKQATKLTSLTSLALIVSAAVIVGCGDNQTHPGHTTLQTGTGGTGGEGTISCIPNLDGKIDAAELKAALNVPVNYLVGKDRPIDLAGQTDGAGHLVWDFSQDLASDAKITIEATALADKWFQASFPSGQWVAPIDAAGTLQGVYSADEQAIYIHGLASREEKPKDGQTLVVYEEPAAIYRLPLVIGAHWTSLGKAQTGALIHNIPYAGTDTYEVTDDANGEMDLHDFKFTQVHRIRTKATVAPAAGGLPQVTRQVSFVFECFGEVVRATAATVDQGSPGDKDGDFTTAAELRRLGQ